MLTKLTTEQMEKITPMMKKYMETKLEYPDCILFYRLGDFYEMFFEDALTASKVLEITLTGKDCGLDERAPMCGIPYHAAETYITKLVQNGYKVAIGEQVEDPKLAKGLVKREVIRVVTPGTILSAQALDESRNNYIMCVAYLDKSLGISIADVTTGDFYVTELPDTERLADEIFRFSPSEIITNEAFCMSGVDLQAISDRGVHFTYSTLDNWYFDEDGCERLLKDHFHLLAVDALGLKDFPTGIVAAGAMLNYLYQTQKTTLPHITAIKPYSTGKYMILDTATRRNLELTETMREKQKRGSLLWVLDKTCTAMGARQLRSYLEQPLLDKKEILARQDAVAEFCENYIDREEMREYLNPIYDLERLIARISYQTANPRDLISFKTSLEMLPYIKRLLRGFKSKELAQIEEQIDDLKDIHDLIDAAILDDPPILIREGGMIKEGFDETVDTLRSSKTEGKTWLSELEASERERTGIKNLKIKYNKVFGYYLEVTNSFRDQVPEDYVRKQTLANAERFTTPRLKELEDMILGAEDRLVSLEYDLFCKVRDQIAGEVKRIQETAHALARLDVLVSLAVVADKNHYVRPAINEKGILDIKGGRHPVVEKMIPGEMFISNDTYLDNGENRLDIITGPNMAGKSTYMRQTALIVLMAQIGSFVPAESANIGICDRIFTRVGASDDLASGQSTFMIEMTEVANILCHATKNSLLILDEIGRGTSTFDGMSIAWAVVEYIADKSILGAKTLFATHYHELTELEGTLPGVHNYCIAVKEQGEDIIFLRKIMKGGADKSYGIQVARLAGVPEKVLKRARVLVEELSDADITHRARELAQIHAGQLSAKRVPKPDDVDAGQLTMFAAVEEDSILQEITDLELGNMTPIDALNTLYRIQAKLKNRV